MQYNRLKGENMDKDEIILRISKLRQRNNLSARALSLRIGKHETYINRMEQNRFEPSFSTLKEILDVCNCSFEEFFADDFEHYNTNIILQKIIQKLTAPQREALLDFLNKL